MNRRCLVPLLTVLLSLATLAGCQAPAPSSSSRPQVWASTATWAAVARAVVGDRADVAAAITSAAQDPHDYEPNASDKLAVQRAGVVVVNGGGYDDWAEKLVPDSRHDGVINAVEASGLTGNEHVFYSLTGSAKVAAAIADAMATVDPAGAQTYRDNAATFERRTGELRTRAAAVATNRSLTALATEPVSGFLLSDMGIRDVTPAEFVEQSETSQGPSAAVVQETLDVLRNHGASLLVLNGQTEDEVSRRLVDAATGAGIGIVRVTETLPDGVTDYVDWLAATVDDIAAVAAKVK